jgi:site-specific DNA recombinase
VLVYHTSRFARNQLEARRYKTMLRDRLGVAVISVTQPLGQDPSDPSAFLSESIHEMFDEYYSISLSFWTRAGLREKARQGHLTGTLPWGYRRDPASGGILRDDHRAPLVQALFERYAHGDQSDRALAVWLNSQGARTTKDRAFSKDTVREMLVNAAYAGYVTARRDKTRHTPGKHPAIITNDVFDRVQQIRTARTTTLNPGRPSTGYALAKLLRCERCGAAMHGGRSGPSLVRRYHCSTRKQQGTCDQPAPLADTLEAQLASYLSNLAPPASVREAILTRLAHEATRDGAKRQEERAALQGQLDRLKDLYQLGDLTRSQYLYRRQLLQHQLDAHQPPVLIDLEQAAAALADLASLYQQEAGAAERNGLLRIIFERVWQDDGHLVALQPRTSFQPYFTTPQKTPRWKERERRDSNPRPPA